MSSIVLALELRREGLTVLNLFDWMPKALAVSRALRTAPVASVVGDVYDTVFEVLVVVVSVRSDSLLKIGISTRSLAM